MPKVKVKIKFNEIDKKTILKAHEYFIQRYTNIKAGEFQKKYSKSALHFGKKEVVLFGNFR